MFPESELDLVEVEVDYPGASPQDVEQGILRPVEGAIRGIDGMKRFDSEAREGNGEVYIELVPGQDRIKVFRVR